MAVRKAAPLPALQTCRSGLIRGSAAASSWINSQEPSVEQSSTITNSSSSGTGEVSTRATISRSVQTSL